MTKMGRKPWFDKNGMKKGAWSQEEDDKLRAYIQRYGHRNWRQLPKFAGLSRCGKSCRLRWLNYLQQDLKKGNFTREEEDIILKVQAQHGNKWSVISAQLAGRTDNEIKNYWNSRLKKSRQIHSTTLESVGQSSVNSLWGGNKEKDSETCLSEAGHKLKLTQKVTFEDVLPDQQISFEEFITFSESSSSGLSSIDFDYLLLSDITSLETYCKSYFEHDENNWAEPLWE